MRYHLAEKTLLALTEALGQAVKERVRGVLRGLVMVLTHHGANSVVLTSATEQFAVYLSVEQETLFLKRAKLLTQTPMAWFLRCPAPECETTDRIVFHGAWRRWSKSRLIAYNRRNVHLWFSFLQCKRSSLPLSTGIVYETYQKHQARMTRPDPLAGVEGDAIVARFLQLLKPVTDMIKSGLARVVDRELYLLDHHASQNASWEGGRKDLGQLGALRSRLIEEHTGKSEPVFAPRRTDVLRMSWEPIVASKSSASIGSTSKEKVAVSYTTLVQNHVESELGDPDLGRTWVDSIRSWAIQDITRYEGVLPAEIQAVLEPLKVRVISKGPSAPYYFAKGLQSALHGIMRHMPCFRLIGRPLSPTDLMDLDRGEQADLWYSGDYEASTDNSSARLGMAIFETLVSELDDCDIDVYKAVLAPHLVNYPRVPGMPDLAPVLQTNGQLMGSVLSFPVLCLMNLGLYLQTVFDGIDSPTKKQITEACDKVLINGDDILYRASRAETERHAANGKAVGLSMSVGKTYAHRRYANVNSTSIDYVMGGDRTGTPCQIDFLNTGLFFGQHKVMGRVGADVEEGSKSSTTSVIDTFLSGALPGRQAELLGEFLHQNAPAIRQETRGRNLFIAKSLGGMGVRRPVGFRLRATVGQMQLAGVLYSLTDNPMVAIQPYFRKVYRTAASKIEPWVPMVSSPKELRELTSRFRRQYNRIRKSALLEAGITSSSRWSWLERSPAQ